MLNIDYIKEHIDNASDIDIEVKECVTSTNTWLKEYAQDKHKNADKKAKLLIAEKQTSGKGTKGRSFYSPGLSGIYFSLLLYPEMSPEHSLRLTSSAAVAVCNSVKTVCGIETGIKWVNDVCKDGRKICGILCESAIGSNGVLEHTVVGVGINIQEPIGGFPADIASKASALYRGGVSLPDLIRESIVSEFVNEYLALYNTIDSDTIYESYKERLFITGKRVHVIKGDIIKDALVVGLNKDFSLKVTYDGVNTEDLSHGEVSLAL